MTNKIFDSLNHTKSLEKVGFSRQQAEMQVEIMGKIITANLLTKDEYQIGCLITKQDLQKDIHSIKTEVRHEVLAAKVELKEDVSGIRIDIKEIKDYVAILRTEVLAIKSDLGDKIIKNIRVSVIILGVLISLLALYKK